MKISTIASAQSSTANAAYASLLEKYTARARSLEQQLRALSLVRLFLFAGFIFLGYKAMRSGDHLFTAGSVGCFIAFLLIIRLYDKLQSKARFYAALARINRQELLFLDGASPVYDNGEEYKDPHHPYSHDLDLFGESGLFGYINRCSTTFGRDALAQALLHPDTAVIAARQEAIAELAAETDFRQHLQAYGSMHETREKELKDLKAWLHSPPLFTSKALYYGLMIFPLGIVGCVIYYLFSGQQKAMDLLYILFILNLLISFGFGRKISAHLSVSTSVNKLLQQFSEQLRMVEEQPFRSAFLRECQQRGRAAGVAASRSIARLASLFNYLETVINLLVSILLNGLSLFHVHVLFAIEQWKKKNGRFVPDWLSMLGEMEALSSFANLAGNNPAFCRPEISATQTLVADNMGHPLIRQEKRITNSISFARQKFVILTGSNMSGKSTFLRTLGINLVLARAGSMVCASRFVFYPYDVYVSMRITDSLQDSESFFYAELKRLHSIIEHLQSGHSTFILLDEILRGTNSNDKRNGTIGLIRKLAAMNACGIIATHDIVVADLVKEYPDYISNNCFESEIVNDELLFDYKLKQGICTRLNASFLMKKLGVID